MLNFAADKRTICEVLREINDLMQGEPVHVKALPLLVEAEGMAKRMSRKLYEYDKEYDKDWWDVNPESATKMERRLNENYISG